MWAPPLLLVLLPTEPEHQHHKTCDTQYFNPTFMWISCKAVTLSHSRPHADWKLYPVACRGWGTWQSYSRRPQSSQNPLWLMTPLLQTIKQSQWTSLYRNTMTTSHFELSLLSFIAVRTPEFIRKERKSSLCSSDLVKHRHQNKLLPVAQEKRRKSTNGVTPASQSRGQGSCIRLVSKLC